MKAFRFRELEVYRKAMDYLDAVYSLTENLDQKAPSVLRDNLNQAATHIVVNIAGKSSGKSEIERNFLINGCLMSFFETIACLDIVQRRRYAGKKELELVRSKGEELRTILGAMKKGMGE